MSFKAGHIVIHGVVFENAPPKMPGLCIGCCFAYELERVNQRHCAIDVINDRSACMKHDCIHTATTPKAQELATSLIVAKKLQGS